MGKMAFLFDLAASSAARQAYLRPPSHLTLTFLITLLRYMTQGLDRVDIDSIYARPIESVEER